MMYLIPKNHQPQLVFFFNWTFFKPAFRCISVTALVASSGDAKHTKPKPWHPTS